MRNSLALGLIVILLFSFGCSLAGPEITQEQIQLIEQGKTTKDEMIAIFGQPQNSSYGTDGILVMEWMYVRQGLYGIGYHTQGLSVLYDKNGVVEKYTFTDDKAK